MVSLVGEVGGLEAEGEAGEGGEVVGVFVKADGETGVELEVVVDEVGGTGVDEVFVGEFAGEAGVFDEDAQAVGDGVAEDGGVCEAPEVAEVVVVEACEFDLHAVSEAIGDGPGEGGDESAFPFAGGGIDVALDGEGDVWEEGEGGGAAVVAPEVDFGAELEAAEAVVFGDGAGGGFALGKPGEDDELEVGVVGEAVFEIGFGDGPGVGAGAVVVVAGEGEGAGFDLEHALGDGIGGLGGIGTIGGEGADHF